MIYCCHVLHTQERIMSQTDEWDPTEYPEVVHRAMAVYVILQAYGIDLEEDVCICVSSVSLMVVLQLDDMEEILFHVGEPDRPVEEMGQLCADYAKIWQDFRDDEFVEWAHDCLPISAMHPIVVAELESNGILPEGQGLPGLH